MIIVVFLLLFFLKKEKSKIVFTKLIQIKIFNAVKDKLTESFDSFYEDIPRLKDVLLPFCISIFGWIIKFTELFLISRLFSIDVPFVYFILIIAIANIVASIPISIYGLGTREAALITMFSIFNVLPEKILSLTLFWFVIIWLTPSSIGAFVTFFETKNFNTSSINEKTVERFSNYMKRYPEFYRNLAGIVKSNIPKNVDKQVIVDLGMGPGLLSLEMSKQISNATIIGIDSSEIMLKMTKINVTKDGFQTIHGASENIPLKSNSVDIIVSRFSLAYWKKPIESFSEIHRVLKPGGKFILEALNQDFSKLRLFLIKIHMFFKSAGVDVIRYHSEAFKIAYKIQHIEQLLNKKGFKITNKEADEKDWKFIVVAKK
jgi:ubiquinone/menaquinone biosynthesis C-methylase UbiE